MKKDFLSILDISKGELEQILCEAGHLKTLKKQGKVHDVLRGKNLAMIFEKSSTSTHISFEVGMDELGGHALFLNARDMQIWRGEEIRDTARAASRYVSGMMIRAYKHSTIEEFALHATIPVINGLSDLEHPCQLLADILTMQEHFGSTRELNVAWVGDGNNRVAEIPSQDRPQRWLVEQLWGASSVGLIGGAPKCSKTWLGLDLALSVATGTACLGRYAVPEPGPVLVYLAEDALPIVCGNASRAWPGIAV